MIAHLFTCVGVSYCGLNQLNCTYNNMTESKLDKQTEHLRDQLSPGCTMTSIISPNTKVGQERICLSSPNIESVP